MRDTNRQFRLAKRPEGKPDRDTFDLVETDVPEPGPGEVLVRTRYLSVDPYMRDRMSAGESYSEPWEVGDQLQGGRSGRSSSPTAPSSTRATSSSATSNGPTTPPPPRAT